MMKRRYTYTVLRYVHDPLSAEFVNVGVVLLCPATSGMPALLKSNIRRTVGRMREMFPDLDQKAFRSTMRTIERMLDRMADTLATDGLITRDGDAATFAQAVIPADDSSLQWSPVGSGAAEDPEKAFERLYARFVTRYDMRQTARRTDEEVWKPVRQMIEQRNLPVDFEAKTIVGTDDKIDFQHGWKNGAWHVYEALSFDLADADGIYKKVHRWLGQLASVVPEATEEFHPYFIVGAPSDPGLQSAYRRAIKILKKSPGGVQVFEEADVEKLVDRIEDDVREHLVN